MKIANPYSVLGIQTTPTKANTQTQPAKTNREEVPLNASFSMGHTLSPQTTQGLLQSQEVTNEVTEPKSAREQFLEYMEMTPEQRLFYAFVKNKEGLSKEEFEALPSDEQERIKQEIEKEIKEKIETGQLKPEEIAFYT